MAKAQAEPSVCIYYFLCVVCSTYHFREHNLNRCDNPAKQTRQNLMRVVAYSCMSFPLFCSVLSIIVAAVFRGVLRGWRESKGSSGIRIVSCLTAKQAKLDSDKNTIQHGDQ